MQNNTDAVCKKKRPAAAVIPAPIAYIKVVAVKKLVVGCLASGGGPLHGENTSWRLLLEDDRCPSLDGGWIRDLYFEKIRVFKAGICLDTLAWNNRIGLWFYFVGF